MLIYIILYSLKPSPKWSKAHKYMYVGVSIVMNNNVKRYNIFIGFQ